MRCNLLGVMVGLALCAGCDGSETVIEDRFFECRDLVSDKDARDDSLACFTPRSRAILSGLLRERDESAGVLDYIERYRKLLDYDEVVMPAEIENKVAMLVVSKGRQRETIFFEYDDASGRWLIDAIELSGFWYGLDRALEEL